MTAVVSLLNKVNRTKTYKVIVCLDSEDTQRRVLKDGIFLGFQHHKCVEALEKGRGDTGNSINQCYKCQKWDPDHTSGQCKARRACVWCGDDHFHRECSHFQSKSRENAKCANCNEAHPAWSKSCAAFIAASKNSSQASAAKVVSSATVGRADLQAEIKMAMAALWGSLARVISTVVSKSLLDLDAEQKKPKMNRGDLAMKTTAHTVRAIKECGLLHPNSSLEVAGVQEAVWKELFPQATFPQPSQASSTPLQNKDTIKS